MALGVSEASAVQRQDVNKDVVSAGKETVSEEKAGKKTVAAVKAGKETVALMARVTGALTRAAITVQLVEG